MFFLLLSFFRAWKRAYLGAIDDDGYYHYWRKALFIVWRRETASLFVCFCSCIRSFKPLIVTRTRRRTHFWRRDGKRCRFLLFVLSFLLSFFSVSKRTHTPLIAMICSPFPNGRTYLYAIDCYHYERQTFWWYPFICFYSLFSKWTCLYTIYYNCYRYNDHHYYFYYYYYYY